LFYNNKASLKEEKMRKIILGLFIILFCFAVGIPASQEKILSKEERDTIEKIKIKKGEIAIKIESLWAEIEKLQEQGFELQKQILAIDPKFDELAWIDKYFEEKKASEKPIEQTSWYDQLIKQNRTEDEVAKIEKAKDDLHWEVENSASELRRIKDEILIQMNGPKPWDIDFYDILMLDSILRSPYYLSPYRTYIYPYGIGYPYLGKRSPTNNAWLYILQAETDKANRDMWLRLLLNRK
jgi:hypothetical protein